MKQIFIIITLLLLVVCSVNGQEKVYYDSERNITNDIGNAVEYKITEKSAVGHDSLFKVITYYMPGQKKSENSFLKVFKKGKFIEQKFIGEKWEWFNDGRTQLKAFYIDGKLQGEFCTYWPIGIQRRKDIYDKGELIEGNCYDSAGIKIPEYFPYQTMPEFPGGKNDLFSFLAKEVNYPIEALEKGIQGNVIIQFYVDIDGKLCDIKILNTNNYYLEMEALRVAKAMPLWTPGTHEGQKTKVRFSLPINFKLQ